MDLPSAAFSSPLSPLESKLIGTFNDETDSEDNFSDVTEEAVIERDDDASNWTFTCPLTSEKFPSKSALDDFWKCTYATTLEDIVNQRSPLVATAVDTPSRNTISQDAFLYYCILINYLRTRSGQQNSPLQDPLPITGNQAHIEKNTNVSAIADCAKLKLTAKELLNSITHTSDFWYDDQYLFPKIQDDPLIRAFGGWKTSQKDACRDTDDEETDDEDDDGLQQDPYQECIGQRFLVGGESVPSHEFLTEQAKSLRDLGAFDSMM